MKTLKNPTGTTTASDALRRDVEMRMTPRQRELLLTAHTVSTDGDRIVFLDRDGCSFEDRLPSRTPAQWALEIIRRLDERSAFTPEQRDALANELFTSLAIIQRETRDSLAGHYVAGHVEFLACLALDHGEISEGRAAEILNIDRLRVRELHDEHRAQLERERSR